MSRAAVPPRQSGRNGHAEGRSNAGIARQIWVAEATVEKHVRSILGQLDLRKAPAITGGCRPCLPISAPPEADRTNLGYEPRFPG